MSCPLLILSLPTQNATARQRIWRGLKASGAAVLRDGVYLLPDLPACRQTLQALAAEVEAADGQAMILDVQANAAHPFGPLFDRSAEYAALLEELNALRQALSAETAAQTQRELRRLRKQAVAIAAIDFFPGEAQRQVDAALLEAEVAAAQALCPGEPLPGAEPPMRRQRAQYQGRVWATRARPWVDRLACAWVIRRFIDPAATFLWLASPAACPADALGFDFDGATFTHAADCVTFEVLVQSFGLEQPGLRPLGQLVHFLDVGGVEPPQAAGVEAVLAGLRAGIADDDALCAAAGAVFDGLLAAFEQPPKAKAPV